MENELKLNSTHYRNDVRDWLTVLGELRTENIRLKEQLSEAVSREVSLEFVEQAEQFQQAFVEKDQVMDLLRHDISMLLFRLPDREPAIADTHQLAVLEKDMALLILEFQQMRTAFTFFLAGNDKNGAVSS